MRSWHYEIVEACDGDDEFWVEVGKGERKDDYEGSWEIKGGKAGDRPWGTWDVKSYEGKGILVSHFSAFPASRK